MRDRYLIDRMMRRDRDRRRDYRDRYRDYNDYRDYRDYNDERDYHYAKDDFTKDLMPLIERLSQRDRFKLQKQDIITKAKQMGVRFDQFSEEEFIATYYIISSDYGNSLNDVHQVIALTKDFLMDDDVPMSPSDKLAIYIDCIIRGESF